MATWLQAFRLLPSYQLGVGQIVCMDGVQGDFLCRPATNNAVDVPIGVTQDGYDIPPGLIAALSQGTATYTPVAAQPGEEVLIRSIGDIAPVLLGASATAGALISFNSSGGAIMVAPGSGVFYAGIAQQAGGVGGLINMLIQPGKS